MYKIKDLHQGDTKVIRCLVKKCEKKTGASGKPYVNITFTDGETTMSANKFDTPVFPYEGKVLDMTLEYGSKGYVNVKACSQAFDAKISDYVQTAPGDANRMIGDIEEEIVRMDDHPDIKAITKALFVKYRADIKKWSAAKSMHHNYIGGLLYHIWRMMRSGICMSTVYNLDRTMLSAGIILHDIGKLVELKSDEFGSAEYTIAGNLFGHLYIGAEMIDKTRAALGLEESEDVMLLKHMILSHHNKLEFGAVKRPATKEAFALAMIDEMDSKIEQYEQELNKLEPGTCGNTKMDGIVVYKS